MRTSDYFNLGCKLFGVYFLVLSVPLFISAISTSSYLTFSNAPGVFDYFVQHEYASQKFFPSAITIALGVYLIKDVEGAFEVITQILDILPNGFHEGIAVGLQDSDVVEFTFNNEDFTIVQDGRLDLNREQ